MREKKMIKKSVAIIIAAVIIVAAAALVFSTYTNHNNPTNNSSLEKQQPSVNDIDTSTNTNLTKTSSEKVKKTNIMSPAEAKKLAKKYFGEPGFTAGTPKLSKENGKYIYTVPIIENGKNIGFIDIDAQTGESLGGAVPNG